MNNKTDAVEFYKRSFRLTGEGQPIDISKRHEALETLSNIGFPTLKDEDWRFTNVAPILKEKFEIASTNVEIDEKLVSDAFLDGFEYDKLVFIDGKFVPELSDEPQLPEGVIIGSLNKLYGKYSEIIEKYFGRAATIKTGFDALNQAFTEDGVFVYLPAGAVVEKPVQVLFYGSSENNLNSPRNLIVAERNSSLKLVFNYNGGDGTKYFTNAANEIFIGENANVDLYKFQDESHRAFHIDRTDIVQENSSVFSHYSFSFGADLARNDINAKLDGENVTGNLYGLYLGNNKQHVDHHTFVDHAKPNSFSNELYKGIMDGESNGVFSGKILVRKDAQKTNAYQSNKNVLLTGNASVDTKPQLGIYADDVKCSHGATVGALNPDSYFYIRSRGIPANIAKSMLIRAFAADVLEKVKIEGLRDTLNHILFEHLHRVEI